MSLEMPFEMRNLTSFPIEKLCYDLKLEVLEEMDAKDTIELAKVNAGFQWMLSRNPSLVFNHHVDTIRLDDGKIWLKKFPDSPGATLNLVRDFPLIKAINSCDSLTIDAGEEPFTDRHAEFLNHFTSVNRLWLFLDEGDDLAVFVDSFRVSIKEQAMLSVQSSAFRDDQVVKERFQEFIETKLNDCRRIDLDFCTDTSFHFYDGALEKTRVRFVQMSTVTNLFPLILSSIVNHGIASRNLETSFRVDGGRVPAMNAQVVNFLTQYPGMRRIEGEMREKLLRLRSDRLSDGWSSFDAESFCFRQKIDLVRDCVYICPSNSPYTHFFAFYVPPEDC